MYRVVKKTVSFIVLVSLSLSLLSVAKQWQKKPAQNGQRPFADKWQRHQRKADNSILRQSFVHEIAGLSGKAAASKTQAVTQAQPVWKKAVDRLQKLSDGTLTIRWDENEAVPIFMRGRQLQEKVTVQKASLSLESASQQGMDFFLENKQLLQIADPAREFQLVENQTDRYGLTHLRYQQVYRGLEVWGRDVRVHMNADGFVDAFNGRSVPSTKLSFLPAESVTEASALSIARDIFGKTPAHSSSRKIIYLDAAGAHIVWLVELQKGLDQNWHYFIDAANGEVLKTYNHVMTDGPVTGSGQDLAGQTRTLNLYQLGSDFLMIDASKPMFNAAGSTLPQDGKGVIYTLDTRNADSTMFFVTSNDVNNWGVTPAVSASANGALVYDFYNQVFNRNAIDGQGSTMNLVVNFKQNFNNAFWNGQFMVFGNGDGVAFSDLAEAIDVTAHEMTHGVIERTANLVYENQSGALNESFADVFGVLFEFWVKGENGNWFLGEDVTTPGIAGDVLRNMEDPGAANVALNGQQPTRMSEFQNLPNTPQGDNGGVHINSGIPNRAFYLFATNPAVGRDKAGEVYYQTLTNYLTRNSQFIDCRLAVLKAVDDVFGAGTPEASAAAAAAAQAFDTVEIFDGNGTPPPADLPPVVGDEFVAVLEAATGALFRYTPATQEIVQLSSNGLSSRPSVTDDGQFIFYVDNTNNIHLMASDGSSDQALSTSGGFSNVAVSPSGQFLAATSTFTEAVIYIFDLTDPSGASDKQIQLYTPTTAEGTTAGNVLFPDRLDWASDSDILMYDAFNIAVSASGDTTGYWDINLLRTSDGAIGRLFPPQPPGVNIGNPVFSSNNDNIIALDFIDENGDVTVLGVNLNTGATGDITFNFNSPGSPSFSNDDSKVYYHFTDQSGSSVWVVDLQEDGITGAGNDQGLINGAVFPVVYAVGSRPTSVEEQPASVPDAFALLQNYPNPFNPQTSIRYQLPEASDVSVKIFDITGRLVAEIDSGHREAGTRVVNWNGRDNRNRPVASGVYFYRLEAKTSGGKMISLSNKMTLLK